MFSKIPKYSIDITCNGIHHNIILLPINLVEYKDLRLKVQYYEVIKQLRSYITCILITKFTTQ